MKFEESKTKENLEKALQGEALAHMRYMIYASLLGKTSKSLEEEIIKIAHNEKEHWKVFAKLLFDEKYLNGETRDLYFLEWNRNLNIQVKDIKVKAL